MPFGLTNASAIFMNLMNLILVSMLDKFILVFLDNILVYSESKEEYLQHIREVLTVLHQNQLYAKPAKCEFAKDTVEYLRFLIGINSIGPKERKTKIIKEWKIPTLVTDV